MAECRESGPCPGQGTPWRGSWRLDSSQPQALLAPGNSTLLTISSGASPFRPKRYKAALKSPLHCLPVTMKAVLVALLAAGLALQPGETPASHGGRARGAELGWGHWREARGVERRGGGRRDREKGGRGRKGFHLDRVPSGAALSTAQMQKPFARSLPRAAPETGRPGSPGFSRSSLEQGQAPVSPPGLARSLRAQGPWVVTEPLRASASLLQSGDHDSGPQGHWGSACV